MVDEPYRNNSVRNRRAARQRNRGDQFDTPTGESSGPALDEARENRNRGAQPAQPERVDPPVEPSSSVRATVASNSEVSGFNPNTESIADRLTRQRNFVGGPSGRQIINAQEIPPGVRTTNIEDAPIARQIDADRRTRQETGGAPASNTQVSGSGGGYTFKPNILSNYENPTYHFRLSVTNPNLIKSGDPNLPRVVLAETANSVYYIEDVEINEYVNFDPQHRNQGFFKADMTIVEPTGSSFLDYTFAAATQAGVSNWMLTPYVLELWFIGRNPETGQEETIENKVWTWYLYLTNPKINVDEGGTKYTFSFRGFNYRSLEDDINVTDTEFTIRATTVGEFLDKLGNKLNEAEKAKRQSGPVAINEYKWEVNEPLKNQLVTKPVRQWNIIPKNFNENSQRAVSVDTNDQGKATIHINKGTDLGKLIENIIGTTEEGAKLATGFNNIFAIEGQEPAYEWKYIPAVEPIINYSSYEGAVSDYNKTVTYNIFFRRTTAVSINIQETKKVNSKSKQQKRLKELNKTGLMVKRYDYIFTGRNTEVLNFDLEFNTLWRAPALYYGSVHHYESITTGPKVNEQKLSYLKGLEQKKKLLSSLSATSNQAQALEGGAQAFARDFISNSYQDVKGRVEEVSGGQVTVSESEFQAVQDRDARAARREQQEQNATQRFKQQAQNFDQGVIRIGELPDEFTAGQARIQLSLDQYDSNPRVDIASMTESDWTPIKSLFGLAIHQAYGMTSGDLARMEIEIRGDFYWLGRPNSEFYGSGVVSENNLQQAGSQSFIEPDFKEGQQHFLLNFGYPRNPNEEPGINRERFASAVYQVVRALHKFEGGKFTQTLTCIREPLTNPDVVGSDIFKIRPQ